MSKPKLMLDSSKVIAALTRASSVESKNNQPEQQSPGVRNVKAAGLTEYNSAPAGDLGCGGGGGCIAVAAK